MATKLSTVIERKANLNVKKLAVMAEKKPDIPKDLAEYSRPIWTVIRNQTQFKINHIKTYLESGRFNGETLDTQPFEAHAFGMSNKTTFLGMGYRLHVGLAFRVELDGMHSFEFSIGCSSPLVGPFTAAIRSGNDPKQALHDSTQYGGSIESEVYSGVSQDDEEVSFKLRLVITPGGNPMTVSISQDIVS
jgi:hypothetical protein